MEEIILQYLPCYNDFNLCSLVYKIHQLRGENKVVEAQ